MPLGGEKLDLLLEKNVLWANKVGGRVALIVKGLVGRGEGVQRIL